MSRFKRFAHSLASGYLLLVTNVFFTLAQVPLALHYLSKNEFGLWALTTQITGYLLMLDLGMSGSLVRNLIDHKDDKSGGKYGSIILTGSLVLLVQGAFIALGGVILSFGLDWLFPSVEPELMGDFRMLVAGQCVLVGISFVGRLASLILQSHQRFDVSNYASIVTFAVIFAVQWITFHMGMKLYSLLVAAAVSTACGLIINFAGVIRLKLFPAKGRWGSASMALFKEIFRFGNELFLLTLGLQLLNASQVVIISRTLGLSAAGTWAIATRTFLLAFQAVSRIFDFSAGALGEMIVRGERVNLLRRYRDVMLLTALAGVFICVSIALCNSSFLKVWTSMSGRDPVGWELRNDILMALLVLLNCVTRCHINLAIFAKEISAMRWIYFLQGALFVAAGFLVAPRFGITGIIVAAIVAEILCIGIYGFRWGSGYLSVASGEMLVRWLGPAFKYLFALSGVAISAGMATTQLPPLTQLLVNAGVVGGVGLVMCWFLGLTNELRSELLTRFANVRARFKR
jgi:O-antigen/teichoic acid export membrane protein